VELEASSVVNETVDDGDNVSGRWKMGMRIELFTALGQLH
jgi:hypothetical protein